jgi:hypothetical protein
MPFTQIVAVVTKNGAGSSFDSALVLKSECESDAAKSGTSAEPESDSDLFGDSEELSSANEVAFPAQHMRVNDLNILMERSHQVLPSQPARTLILLCGAFWA